MKIAELVNEQLAIGGHQAHHVNNSIKKGIIKIFNITGGLYLLLFFLLNSYYGRPAEAIINLTAAIAACLISLLVTRKNMVELAGLCVLPILMILFTYLFCTGGLSNTGFMWLFTFPIVSFFLRGKGAGLLWCIFANRQQR